MTAKVELLTPSGGKVILDPTNTAVDRVLTLPAVAGTVFNQGNVVGTVSQSSGVPTGSIIERGSNANGEFVKYADGTMICLSMPITAATESSVGSVFRSDSITFTYPATFASTPTIAGNGGSINRLCAPSTPGLSNVIFRVLGTTSSNVELGAQLIAIGRWF